MTDIVNEHVASRAAYFRKVYAEAAALIESKKEQMREKGFITLDRDELNVLRIPNQVYFECAYSLDEAMAALDFYAEDTTWTEVPAKTFAAEDRGQKARVALARINPV